MKLLVVLLALSAHAKSYDKEAVRQVMRKTLPEFKACYAKEIKNNAALHGKVVLEWDIDSAGNVQNAKVKSSQLNSPEVEECLVGQLKALKFPVPPAGTSGAVSYPFVFEKK